MTRHTNPYPQWTVRLLAAAVPALLVAGAASLSVVSERQRAADISAAPIVPAAPTAPALSPATPVPAPTVPRAIARPAPAVPAVTPVRPANVAALTLVNEFPGDARLMINGASYLLAPGQQVSGVLVTPSPNGNDVVELTMSDDPACGSGQSQRTFTAGGSYVLTIVAGPIGCFPDVAAAPSLTVTPT